jgi:hypothetical protein
MVIMKIFHLNILFHDILVLLVPCKPDIKVRMGIHLPLPRLL